MKKLLLVLALVIVVVFVVSRGNTPAPTAGDEVSQKSSAPESESKPAPSGLAALWPKKEAAAPSAAPAVSQPVDEREAGSVSKREAPTAVYFPNAPIVSSITEDGPKPGQTTTTKTLETKLSPPFVRVEQTYAMKNGVNTLVEEKAMVSNQLLLKQPARVPQESFLSALRQAGASDTKIMGAAVLATFPARPEDPKALDDYLARVRGIVGPDVTIEPNYLRKII